MVDLHHIRKEYAASELSESDVDSDPIEQFRRWLKEAMSAGVSEPHAMTLATATPQGAPAARIVLLRSVDHRGFTFFTNYRSRKGRELEANQRAALLFFWPEMERQVRIEGTIAFTEEKVSDDYFHQRPRTSQIAAVASAQSEVLPNRQALEALVASLTEEFAGKAVPRPAHWGGYALHPETLEFWQGRASRLHDRLRYRRSESGWVIERLAP